MKSFSIKFGILAGIPGAIGELVFDKLLGTITSAAVNQDRVEMRQSIRAVRENMLRAMSTDNRLNMQDRPKVEKIFPEDTVFTNVDEVRMRATALAELLESRAARKAGLLPDNKVPHLMTKEQIKDAFTKGEMTQEQAIRLLKVYHGFEE